MNNIKSRWDIVGLKYSLSLVIVIGIILLIAKILNISDPTWMLISGIVCTELEAKQARTLLFFRIFATLLGAAIACLILFFIGASYFGILIGVLITSLTCHYIVLFKNSWRLASATCLLVLIAGFEQHSIQFAEITAYKRAVQVVFGSIIAGSISFLIISIPLLLKRQK